MKSCCPLDKFDQHVRQNGMKIFIKSTQWIFLFTCILFVSSCANSGGISYPQVTAQFRIALNTNDVVSLVKLTSLPLTVFEQEWESAQDGIGFVLGRQKINRVDKTEELEKFFEIFAPRVTVEGERAILISLGEYNNFRIEFANSMDQWQKLKTYLFKRGEGDVEHIVLLGIDPKSNKVKAIYLN